MMHAVVGFFSERFKWSFRNVNSINFRNILLLTIASFMGGLIMSPSSHAATGIEWLATQGKIDGSFANPVDISTSFQSTSEVLLTFDVMGESAQPDIPAALQFVNAETYLNTENLSRKIIANTAVGNDVSALVTELVDAQNWDGGFGEFAGYDSAALDTSFALIALAKIGYSDSFVIQDAINYLSQQQQSDGGFLLKQPNESSVYHTAVASIALQNFLFSYNVGAVIEQASNYLLANKTTGAGWGSDWETAISLLAIVPVTTDASLFGSAVDVLSNNQTIEGSWGGDVYITALALQALHLVANVALPVEPTLGVFAGKVIASDSGSPLVGVSITATAVGGATPITAVTVEDGSFSLSNLSPGDYELLYSAAGYVGATQAASVQAGQWVDLGTVSLNSLPNTAIVHGTVIDVDTGLPISGAEINVTGSSNVSVFADALGKFSLLVAPGAVTVTATATGYLEAAGSANIAAGQALNFSPSLYPVGSAAQDLGVTLNGVAVDADTKDPISGVLVVVAGSTTYQTISDSTGGFVISNLESGELVLSLSASGYSALEGSFVTTPGSTIDVGTVFMQKALPPVSSTVVGVITDAATGLALSGATVTVEGTSLSVTTDVYGRYKIESINQLDFSIFVSAAGYLSSFNAISLADYTVTNINFSLNPANVNGVSIDSLATDKAFYDAYNNVGIMAAVSNTSSVSQTLKLLLEVFDSTGQLVQIAPIGNTSIVGAPDESFILLPGTTLDVSTAWFNAAAVPGNYKINLRVFDKYTNKLLAERVAAVGVQVTQQIQELKLITTPRFVNVGEAVQVNLKAEITNQSNVDNTLTLSYALADPNGAVIQNGETTLDVKAGDVTGTYDVASFPYTFSGSGAFPIDIQILSGVVPASIQLDSISVAPSVRVEVDENITPTTVVPDGDKRIRINIQLKGVEAK